MLKPSQIREKEFAKSTMGGYKTSDVDVFLDDVAESYEQLYKENSELLKKLRLLVDNIEEYRRRESAGSDNSVSVANEEAEKIISQARLEAAQIISDAREQSAQVSSGQASLDEIRALCAQEEQRLAGIRAESEKFRKSLLAMYTDHLTLIQSMVDGTAPQKSDSKAEKATDSHEKKLDIQTMDVDERFVYNDIDSFFAEAVAQENGRIKEAFGGFRFEIGIDTIEEVQLGIEESVSDFAEAEGDDLTVHNEPSADIGVEEPTPVENPDEIKPGFRISFPDEEEAQENEEENLDDLFEGFFNK